MGVKVLRRVIVMVGLGCGSLAAWAQAAKPEAAAAVGQAAVGPKDAVLEAAGELVGQALFLRCFCADNNLGFDAQGKVQGAAKTTDWTLSAVNVLKVERKGAGEIELDGVRVAMRYVTDRHEWERHAMNDEKMKILVQVSGDAAVFGRAVRGIFAVGIDVALQRSMPEFWQHYFDPKTAWPEDSVTGKTVYNPGFQAGGQSVVAATVERKGKPTYTAEARQDRVTGVVAVSMIIDAEGVPRRLAVVQPLGYGLDAKVVEAAAKFQFSPAKLANAGVPSNELLRQSFEVEP